MFSSFICCEMGHGNSGFKFFYLFFFTLHYNYIPIHSFLYHYPSYPLYWTVQVLNIFLTIFPCKSSGKENINLYIVPTSFQMMGVVSLTHSCCYGLCACRVSQEINGCGLNCNLHSFTKKKEALIYKNVSGSLHFVVCLRTDFSI